MGWLTCTPGGYTPCHNAEEVIAAAGYDSEADLENPTGSVFCAHGAGINVPWDKVTEYMHLESFLKSAQVSQEKTDFSEAAGRWETGGNSGGGMVSSGLAEDKELEKIFERTYGPVKMCIRDSFSASSRRSCCSFIWALMAANSFARF